MEPVPGTPDTGTTRTTTAQPAAVLRTYPIATRLDPTWRLARPTAGYGAPLTTTPPTATLRTYPIARNLDRLSRAVGGPTAVELRL